MTAFNSRRIVRIVCVALGTLALGGCASGRDVIYTVETSPVPATVEVNSVEVCTTTPCRIFLRCAERWVGLANSPNGKQSTSGLYYVHAYPAEKREGTRLYSQVKPVDPCMMQADQKPVLRFNLELERMAPSQRIHVD